MVKTYLQLADQISRKIARGDLPVGSRLKPQREFAYDQGIAVSTASRVYEELRRRGLASGEVGRGTYVSNRFSPLDPALQEAKNTAIDLEIVFRSDAKSLKELASSAASKLAAGISPDEAAPPAAKASQSMSEALQTFYPSANLLTNAGGVFLAGSGKQALIAAMAALVPRGGRIAVEALTYPFVLSAARLLGIDLVPLALDEEGIIPSALENAASVGLNGVYLQPVLQSPLVLSMSNSRRKEIAAILVRNNLTAIEDRIYGFLSNLKPLANEAPDNTIVIDSLSKRMMPGLTVGVILASDKHQEAIAQSLRAGGWMAPSLTVALAKNWIEDGTVQAIQTRKRAEAAKMFAAANEAFSDLEFHGSAEALHGWLNLPNPWRGDAFAATCAKVGIAVTPGRDFAVLSGNAPAAVRIAFSATDMETWKLALSEIARIAASHPANFHEIQSDGGTVSHSQTS
ncbi:MAG: PLP-dependent aminotransferase family protein [Pseudomonadota bacterium]